MKRAILFLSIATLSGCGTLSMQAKKDIAALGTKAACLATVLGCQQAGGSDELCNLLGLSCQTVGQTAGGVLVGQQSATRATVQAEVTRAYKASPTSAKLRAMKPAKRGIGFTAPHDSTPLKVE